MNKAILKQLELLRSSDTTRSLYSEGMSKLYGSGVFGFLRAMGRVTLTDKDDAEKVALQGAYTAGYQDCLDHLLNFQEFFLDVPIIKSGLKPDFGGRSALRESGDITDREADELGKSR